MERVEVRTGPFGERLVPVLDGLAADDWIVLAGVQMLSDNQPVRPVDRHNRPVELAAQSNAMRFNLSAWALQNRQIVVYLMLLLALVGALSYSKLGQSEDPPFTFKAMVIQTQWPGATAEEVSRQSPNASRRS